MRADPITMSFAQASHRCETCGAKLSSHLRWSKGASEVAIGILLLLVGFAAYEASEHLPAVSPSVRLIAFFAFMGGVFGFTGQRVIKAIEFRPWVPKP